MPDEPNILNYATPEPATFARNSRFVIVLLAIVVPGLSSSLIRRSSKPCLLLCPIIPLALGFFGPLWDEVLFPKRPMREWGLYPFLLVCLAVRFGRPQKVWVDGINGSEVSELCMPARCDLP